MAGACLLRRKSNTWWQQYSGFLTSGKSVRKMYNSFSNELLCGVHWTWMLTLTLQLRKRYSSPRLIQINFAIISFELRGVLNCAGPFCIVESPRSSVPCRQQCISKHCNNASSAGSKQITLKLSLITLWGAYLYQTRGKIIDFIHWQIFLRFPVGVLFFSTKGDA